MALMAQTFILCWAMIALLIGGKFLGELACSAIMEVLLRHVGGRLIDLGF